MVLLESHMLAIDPPPDEICDQSHSLGEQLCPDHRDVPQEGPMALSVILIHVDACEAMCHLLAIMIGNNLHVVALIAIFHKFK